MSVAVVKKRDKERTKNKILSAVGEIIALHGIEKLGINLVAKTSGVNKVLVYRYFDSVDGLVLEYLKKTELHVFACSYPPNDTQEGALEAKGGDLTGLMLGILRDLRNNAPVRNLLRWEMQSCKSMLPEAHNQIRERILQELQALPGDQDTGALLSIVTAGIYYMVIAGGQQDKIIGIDLQSERGWKRIENIIERIIISVI